MPGEPLLLQIAAISVVIAGFTAVTAALVPPGGSWHPAMRLRQRAIVSTSFNVMFESRDRDARPRSWASAGVAVYATGIVTWRGRQLLRAGPSRTPSTVVLFTLGPTAALLFWANALVFGSVAVYALALCIQLSIAAVSFYSLVSASQS